MGMLQVCSPNVPLPMGATVFLGKQQERRQASCDLLASWRANSGRPVAPPTHGEEWAIVQLAIAGNADAQKHLFDRHTVRLHRIAFALLSNKEDAEDAVQDGLCRAYTALRSFQGWSSFSTWLTRIVINSALMFRRRKSTRPEASLSAILEDQEELLPLPVADARPNPERLCAAMEIQALVEKHVRRLPPALAAAFRLGAMDGLSAAEASRALGISVSTFKSRIFRARRKLAGVLQRSHRQFADELA